MGGGLYCNTGAVIMDGVRYESIGDCYWIGGDDWGGGGGEPSGGGGGGGGGTGSRPDLPISQKLKCALDNYAHPNVQFYGGRTLKKVNAWAFGLKDASGNWGYDIRDKNTSPGAGWIPVGGITSAGTAYGRLYNVAFQAHSNFERDGVRGNVSNSLSGPMTAFEMSLFVGVHEMGHLRKEMDEPEADWYGIDALKKYRNDGGKKCSSFQ